MGVGTGPRLPFLLGTGPAGIYILEYIIVNMVGSVCDVNANSLIIVVIFIL